MDFIPEKSEIQVSKIEVRHDQALKDLIKSLRVRHLIPSMNQKGGRRPRGE